MRRIISAIMLVSIAITQVGGCSEDTSNYTPTEHCPGATDSKAKC
jgi:hypothetical protein